MTKVLTRHELEAGFDLDAVLDLLRQGFLAVHGDEVPAQRRRTDLPGPGSATVLFPGLLQDIPAYTVKVNAKFPGARPALRGVVCLFGLDDGELLAMVDSATITAWRTAVAAALATDVLAPASATTLGIVGAGVQATLVAETLCELRQLTHVTVTDIDTRAGHAFAAKWPHTPVDLARTATEVTQSAEIVVLATWSTDPILGNDDIASGVHVTSLGADEPAKRELAPGLLEAATLIVDDRRLASESGVICSAGLSESSIDATLSEVLRHEHPGRSSNDETTVYSPVGLPWQDLALTWVAYQSALHNGTGIDLDLLG